MEKRGDIEKAFFAFLCAKYKIPKKDEDKPLWEMLHRMVYSPNLYCRENAIWAIMELGTLSQVIRCVQQINDRDYYYHSNYVADRLLSYGGDKILLVDRLLGIRKKLRAPLQLEVLSFVRLCTGDRKEEMLAILTDETEDDENRFSAIRYFAKYKYMPAYEAIVGFAETPEKQRWEFAAIAATALATYASERTVNALKHCLSDRNWYIRLNAAVSLENLNVSYMELADIMDGGDRFAREIMRYRLDVRQKMQESGEREAAL